MPILTRQHSKECTSEAVAHGVSTQAYVHARVTTGGFLYGQLIEVRPILTRPHFARLQHDKLLPFHCDSCVLVLHIPGVVYSLQPLKL